MECNTVLGEFLVVFIPALVLVYPAFALLPRAYDWLMQSRILRLYDEMKVIERYSVLGPEGKDLAMLLLRLGRGRLGH